MDLYQFSRYQNISDRLKRLANNQNNKEKMSETLNPQTYRPAQNGNPIRKDNYSFEEEIKSKYSDSKYSNLPLEKKPSQEYGYKTKEANKQSQSAQQRLRKSINSKLYQKRMDKPQENKYQQRQAEEKQQYGNKKILQKVRSQGTIKIEEILESFNNYKQNKEKFISTLAKRQIAQTEYVQQQFQRPRQTKQQTPQGKKTVFKPIDNIWNQNQDEENHPKFKRSLKNFRDGYEELDIFSIIREPQVQSKPKNSSKSKLIQRNMTTTYQPQVSQNNALKRLMSPRSRIPGKICKNRDRLVTNENYES